MKTSLRLITLTVLLISCAVGSQLVQGSTVPLYYYAPPSYYPPFLTDSGYPIAEKTASECVNEREQCTQSLDIEFNSCYVGAQTYDELDTCFDTWDSGLRLCKQEYDRCRRELV